MSAEITQLQAAMAALQAQRALLGDAVVDAALAPMRARLAALQGDGDGQQQLKQVSIVFVDIVGSTSLTQHLHPEDVHAVMDGALARFTASVQALQGKVLQYAGDSMLAVFGAPVAREDDAERAVRCGLDVLRGGAEQGEQVRRQFGHEGFNVRVGVHTGAVLLGGGVDGDGSIRGIAVNIAARLEQTAPPGGLQISQATWQQVRGRFDVHAQPPLAVKGVDEPLTSYRVLGERRQPAREGARGVAGLSTAMVGRDAESAQVREAWAAVLAAPTPGPACALVVADAGMGKSRLLREFEAWIADQDRPPIVLRAGAVPLGHAHPYGLLRELLFQALQIGDEDSPSAACLRFEAGIATLFQADLGAELAQAQAHVLGYLLGLDFAASRHLAGLKEAGAALRQRAFHVAGEWLCRLAAQRQAPVLMRLDDLHWADDGTLDFVAQLLSSRPALRLLVLGLSRPALFERRAHWPAASPAASPGAATASVVTRIGLQPLTPAQGAQLAQALLCRLEPPADAEGEALSSRLRTYLVDRAEGNPFFMEELVKMLIDDGAIVTAMQAPDAQPWRLQAQRLRLERLPTTLVGVLQARLDSLPPSDRASLQRASLVGVRFWDQALAAQDAQAPQAIPRLIDRRLVNAVDEDTRDSPALTASLALHEYAFVNQILHQVTYDTVLKRVRIEGHRQVGEWLAGLGSARAADLLGVAAWHFERAEDATRAAEFYTRSAEHLLGRFAHATVVAHADRALALVGDAAPRLRWRALLARQRSLRLQSRLAEQAADLDALDVLAEALDDDACRATAALRRAVALSASGDASGCVAACPAALELARRAGADDTALSVLSAWAGALRTLGRYDESRQIGHDALALARSLGLADVESELLTGLAAGATQQGRATEAIGLLTESLAIDRRSGNLRNECTALVNLGDAQMHLGDLATARQHFEAALRMARVLGDRAAESISQLNLASVCHFLGDAPAAVQHADAAVQRAAAAGNSEYEAYALIALGHAEAALGHDGRADDAYGRAAERLRALDLGHLALEADAGRARMALARGDAAGARTLIAPVLARLVEGDDALDGCEHPLWMQLSCVHVLQAVADPRAERPIPRSIEHDQRPLWPRARARNTLGSGRRRAGSTVRRVLMVTWSADLGTTTRRMSCKTVVRSFCARVSPRRCWAA